MGIIIVILFVLQAVNLFFLFSNKKIFIKEKVKGIVLKELPKDAKFKDAQSDYQIVYDILESIKLEDWKIKIEEDYRDRKWELHSNSNDQSSIDNISSKLKTLKRSKRLESILQNESN